MDERESLLRRDGALIGIATAGFYINSPVLLFYFASLCVSVFTVMLSGVPAAIDEQRRGVAESDARSMMIWLAAAGLLALPALLRLVGVW
jgi:hypothetical protein